MNLPLTIRSPRSDHCVIEDSAGKWLATVKTDEADPQRAERVKAALESGAPSAKRND